MTRSFRWLLKAARLVHLVVSMVGMLAILFFAVTGFLLNHEGDWEWLQASYTVPPTTAAMPADLLSEVKAAAEKQAEEPPNAEVDSPSMPAKDPTVKLAELKLVEFLRTQYDLRGEAVADLNRDLVVVTFKAPGRHATAQIDLEKGNLEIDVNSKGLMGKLLDLHRGQSKGSGWIWSLLLDGTCFLLVALSMTGLIIWSSLKTRRVLGMLALLGGIAATLAVYFVWVP